MFVYYKEVAYFNYHLLSKELNETPILEEIKLLSIFGSYQNVGADETIEREVYNHVGEGSREQAAGGDVGKPREKIDVGADGGPRREGNPLLVLNGKTCSSKSTWRE